MLGIEYMNKIYFGKLLLLCGTILAFSSSCRAQTSSVDQGLSVEPTSIQTAANPESNGNRGRNDKHLTQISKQVRFGMERPLMTPSQIPLSLWRQIVGHESNDTVRGLLEEQNNAAVWVDGSQVNLNSDGNVDYVVMAKRSPLSGANITTFWLFAGTPDEDFDLVFSGSATEIQLSSVRTRGFRPFTSITIQQKNVIESDYRYVDQSYRRVLQSTTPIRD